MRIVENKYSNHFPLFSSQTFDYYCIMRQQAVTLNPRLLEHQPWTVLLVVWTVSVSGIRFAHFHTVKCISRHCSFLLWRHSCSKKVPVEMESSLSLGWAITFLALFLQSYINWQQHALRVVERVDFLFHFFLLQLMTSEESFTRS